MYATYNSVIGKGRNTAPCGWELQVSYGYEFETSAYVHHRTARWNKINTEAFGNMFTGKVFRPVDGLVGSTGGFEAL